MYFLITVYLVTGVSYLAVLDCLHQTNPCTHYHTSLATSILLLIPYHNMYDIGKDIVWLLFKVVYQCTHFCQSCFAKHTIGSDHPVEMFFFHTWKSPSQHTW